MVQLVTKEEYYKEFYNVLSRKTMENSFNLSKEQYYKIVNEVIAAKQKVKGKVTSDYRRLKRFDIMYVMEEPKLIVPLKDGSCSLQFYVNNDELYDIIHEIHLNSGHAGRNKMLKLIQQKYKNITYEAVMIYINLCKVCQGKHHSKKISTDQIPITKFITTYQLDIIKIDSDNTYNYILLFQDLYTKFLLLKPLKSNTIEEISESLLQLFFTFGAPENIQSPLDNKVISKIMSSIFSKWTQLHIGVEMPRIITKNLQAQSFCIIINRIIRDMLDLWMKKNGVNEWWKGIYFVQYAYNISYNEELENIPFDALFKRKSKKSLFQTGTEVDKRVSGLFNPIFCLKQTLFKIFQKNSKNFSIGSLNQKRN